MKNINKNKKIIGIVGIIGLLIVIIILGIFFGTKKTNKPNDNHNEIKGKNIISTNSKEFEILLNDTWKDKQLNLIKGTLTITYTYKTKDYTASNLKGDLYTKGTMDGIKLNFNPKWTGAEDSKLTESVTKNTLEILILYDIHFYPNNPASLSYDFYLSSY